MKSTNERLDAYINRCIEDACLAEKRENDAIYAYRIIDDMLVFCISSKYRRVRIRVEFRLLRNLKKNFGLCFHLAYPDKYSDDLADCINVSKFCLSRVDDVSPNHAIDEWDALGDGVHTILTSPLGNRPVEELGKQHVNKLVDAGYDYDAQSWENFQQAYVATYGKLPLEGFMDSYKENRRWLNVREIYLRDKNIHDCGYYSVCFEHGYACPCSSTAKVNKGFNIGVWDRMSEEFSQMLDDNDGFYY